jgi:hypothetical protein
MIKNKVRGLRRKCRQMVRRIEAQTELFPAPDSGCDYWHLHLPVTQTFIDSRRTSSKVRRLCVQTLIERAYHLWQLTPEGEDVRVVAAIVLPQLWASQIIVFFGPTHFNGFFDRNSQHQKWDLIQNRSLINKWNLMLPRNFEERGYDEVTHDEEATFKSQVWFIGNLSQ